MRDNLDNDEKEHFRKYKKKGKKFMRDNNGSKKDKLKQRTTKETGKNVIAWTIMRKKTVEKIPEKRK